MTTRRALMVVAAGLCALLVAGPGQAADSFPHAGWEPGGAYDRHYNILDFDSIKGKIKKIVQVVPMEGMDPGVGFVLDMDGEQVTVHLAPLGYLAADSTGLSPGDQVKVKGVWADINDQEVFMASKVKRGEYFSLKVRLTRDGFPFWAMTPEQLAKEQESD